MLKMIHKEEELTTYRQSKDMSKQKIISINKYKSPLEWQNKCFWERTTNKN